MSLLIIFAGSSSDGAPPAPTPVRTLTLSDWDASLTLETMPATLKLWNKPATLTVDDEE